MRLIDLPLYSRIDLFLIENEIPYGSITFRRLIAEELGLEREESIDWLENHSETEWKSVYSLIRLSK
jgi:hypothetical protein